MRSYGLQPMVEAMMRLLAVSPVVLTPAGQIAMATQLCTGQCSGVEAPAGPRMGQGGEG